eukprot:9839216-Karenia_brevis.AAC.1
MNAVEDTPVPQRLAHLLLPAWVRWQLWRRSGESGAGAPGDFGTKVLVEDVEALISSRCSWYAPLMCFRRFTAWRQSGDRMDICAIDGNAKLHRRTCGTPCAET